MPTIILYTAITLDGYISDSEGSVAWLDEFVAADYGFTDFLGSADTLVMGRITYDQVLSFGSWPYFGKQTYVLTRDAGRYTDAAPSAVQFFKGDVRRLAYCLDTINAKRAWLVGGARTSAQFLQHDLIDEMHLAIMPITLGKGMPLFTPVDRGWQFDLLDNRRFDNGVMMMRYGRHSRQEDGSLACAEALPSSA